MSDKAKKKVAFIDEGIDKTIKDFSGIKFHELGKTPNEILQDIACDHGTEVFGVFYRTLNSLMKKDGSKAKNIKDIVEVIDYSFYQAPQPEEDDFTYQNYIPFANNSFNNIFSKVFSLVPNTLNLSMIFSMADYNIKSAMVDSSDQLKRSRQNGTFIVAGAGNEGGIFSTNDIFSQNDLYVFTIGAIYPKDYKKPKNLLIASAPHLQFGLSTPGTGVVLSTLGRFTTYVPQSYPIVSLTDGGFCSRSDAEKHPHLFKVAEYIDICGASFACPSVVAYKTYAELERPDLDLNNIEHLLIASTEEIQTDKLKDGWKTKELSQFMRTVKYNHAQNWNGAGQPTYYEFGLGGIDKDRFIHLVRTWKPQNIVEEEITLSQSKVTYDGQYYSYVFECKTDNEAYVLSLNVENKNVSRQKVNELSITSPMGTESHFFAKTYSWQSFADYSKTMTEKEKENSDFAFWIDTYLEGSINNKLKNTHFYGEDTKGKWVVKSSAPLEKAEIVFRSIKNTPDDTYRYDDRVLKIANPSALADKDGGKNVIDLSYYKNGKTEVELSANKREIRFMTASGKLAKTIPIGEGNFQTIKHAALGGTTMR